MEQLLAQVESTMAVAEGIVGVTHQIKKVHRIKDKKHLYRKKPVHRPVPKSRTTEGPRKKRKTTRLF